MIGTAPEIWVPVSSSVGQPFEDLVCFHGEIGTPIPGVNATPLVATDPDRASELMAAVRTAAGTLGLQTRVLHFTRYDELLDSAIQVFPALRRKPDSPVGEVFCVIAGTPAGDCPQGCPRGQIASHKGIPLVSTEWYRIKPIAVRRWLRGHRFHVLRFHSPEEVPL
jgi:hypothetical protein